MSYGKYSEFKDSGGGWLGAIPNHWLCQKLKFVASTLASNVDKTTKDGELPVKLCNYTDVYYNDFITADMPFMRASATPAQVEKFTLRAGDTIITKDSETPDDIAIPAFVEMDMPGVICGYHLSLVRPNGLMAPRFLNRTFRCAFARAYFATRANGLTRYGLGSNAIENVVFPIPPLEEQTQIAQFLDYETAKIDALIEKQQQLIALLKEKRQAVITNAATKGVDENPNMRDSGINWMGKIPAHWQVLPIKRLFDVSYGLMGEIDRTLEFGTQVLSLPNVLQNGTLDLQGTSFRVLTPDERKAAILKKGDLLFNWRNGSIEHVGKTALFNHDGDYAHVSFLLKLRALSRDILPEFYWLALNGLRSSGFFGSSKLQVNVTYNQTELRRVPLPVPPIDEQRRIVDVVLKKYKAIDSACERVETGIDILQERRAALISAAVTGKIDVRGWKPPVSATSNP